MPAVASVAGWIEAFKMPLREIEGKFTRSELILTGWRSQETATNLNQRARRVQERPDAINGYSTEDLANRVSDRQMVELEKRLGPVAVKIENDEGEVDLRRLTGEEALRFMGAMGLGMGRSLQ